MSRLACRFCQAPLARTFVDLGMSPFANSYVAAEDLASSEAFYPLHTYVCGECRLVQLPMAASPQEIFSDYAYFSSYSDSWLRHAERYAEAAAARFGLGGESRVIEIASNDGYLLRWFRARGIPVHGIEPAANVAAAAEAIGVPTRIDFFSSTLAEELAGEGLTADLLVGNNVLAHTPYLNDFVAGLGKVLRPAGVVTLEFPHLQRLIDGNQFDTIYHEHFSYFSFTTVKRVLEAHALSVFDVEEWPTHGGSLRVFAGRAGGPHAAGGRVGELLAREERLGYGTDAPYDAFGERVKATKRRLLAFLGEAVGAGRRVAGYGAPAKGNTLLNYCGVRTDYVGYTVDRSPHKQGRYLPGTRIPIFAPDRLRADRPDYVLVLPWNLRDEIAEQMRDVHDWGGKFVVAIPEVEVF
ncbi:MAG TPA: class I SAM-dependent methyltransferase [Thermoanaerobaculia bacterium]